jgi:4-amino-4-deoxy-L-arabinose transferase-like glycosyltransferase
MKKILLILILLLSIFLRFWHLGSYPALNADEAAIGYNAYSLIKTGMDEHENVWPLQFQSFNDYKPGFYFYLVIPFVKLFGLNEWSVRIPSATLGVLSVLVLYLLVKELFKDDKFALISAFFLSISPWHIHFSRGGWEVNVATFFMLLGMWLLMKARRKPKYYIHALIYLVLSLYTYHAARIITPLLGLGFLIFYWKDIKTNLKQFLIALGIAFVILIPLGINMIKPNAISRVAGVGLFADIGPINRINEQRGQHTNIQSISAKILHNKFVNYGLAFLENWSQHYHGLFLFVSGEDIQRNKVPETGQMYSYSIALLIIGLWAIFRNSKQWGIILWWLGVAPIAAALTFQSPHALRAQNMVIPLVIISAFGLVQILNWLDKNKNRVLRISCKALLAVIIILGFARYQHMYWVHMAKEYPYSSQYGVKELVKYVSENQDKYDKVFITERYDQPYILFLFYLKYSPEKFQNDHTLTARDTYGFSTVRDFDKYYFETINFQEIKSENPNSLIIGTEEEIPEEANIVKTIYFPGNQIAFRVVAN